MSETIDYLRERLLCDPSTGRLYWVSRCISDFKTQGAWFSWNTKHVGKEAGTEDEKGYRSVLVNKRRYKAHRLVWAFVHGEWPSAAIDHIDGNPRNNAISNLRVVSHAENMRNQKRRKNASGATGVYFRPHINKWVARIRAHDRDTHLGVFATKEEAIAARLAAQISHGYHANHGSAR